MDRIRFKIEGWQGYGGAILNEDLVRVGVGHCGLDLIWLCIAVMEFEI